MRNRAWLKCSVVSVLLFSGILWLNPVSVQPMPQSLGPAFDPHDLQVCAELCRIVAETCFLECHMGGHPPEFSYGECQSHCNPLMGECMQEACRPPRDV